MRKRRISILLSLLAVLLLFTPAGGEAQAAGNPVGTWEGRDFTVAGEAYVGVLTSVTIYENGTYNGMLLQTIPIGGNWRMEDGVILADDATMILENDDTLTVYYGEYEFKCSRKEGAAEGVSALTPSRAADTAVSLLTEAYDRIDGLFSGAIRAMEAVRQYISDGKYSSLIQARILCSEVLSLAEDAAVPENGFEQLDQQALAYLGIDVEHIQIVTAMCEGAKDDVRGVLSVCMNYLLGDHCYTDLGSYMASFTECFETYYRAVGRQQPLLARMIFEPLWSEPSLAGFWSSIPERWSVIGSDFPENTDIESIQNLFLDMIELSEQASNEADQSISSFYALLQEKAEHISSGVYESLRDDFKMPDAAPSALLPLPDAWLEPSKIRFRTEGKETGSALPEEMLLSVQALEGKDYTSYMSRLLPGVSASASLEGNEKDGWHCRIREDGFTFSSEWNPETGTALFRYDPSEVAVVRISFNAVFMGIVSGEGSR